MSEELRHAEALTNRRGFRCAAHVTVSVGQGTRGSRAFSLVALTVLLGGGSIHCGTEEVDEGLGAGGGANDRVAAGRVASDRAADEGGRRATVDSVAIYVRRGRTHMREQTYSRAIAPLSQAVRLDSQSAEAHDLLGLAYAFRLEPGKAIEHIDKAIAIKPSSGTYYMHLGKAYMLKTDYVGATAAYERAIELGLKKGKPYYDLGIIAAREGRLEDARSRFREAVKAAPRFAPSCNLQLGIIAEKLGDQMKAIGLYTKALKGNPDLMTAHYRIALLYLSGGREELAEQHLAHFRRLKVAKGRAME